MEQKRTVNHPAVVIGGGPAGLTAAHELIKLNRRPFVIEKHDKVGGLARTESYKGFHFDMGGHRFFTKSARSQRCGARCSAMISSAGRACRASITSGSSSPIRSSRSTPHGLGLWQSDAHRPELCPLAVLPVPAGGHVRAVGDEPLREAAVPHLLQDIHREGLGHPLLGAQGRMGRAAHQGTVVENGPAEHVPQTPTDDQDPDRGVRLPAPGTRDDVERRQRRAIETARRNRAAGQRRDPASAAGGTASTASIVSCNGHQEIVRGTRLHLQHAGQRVHPEARSTAARRGPARRQPTPLPRLPHRLPDREQARAVSGQLDLHP